MQLTADEITRYSRHIVLPQVGKEGQRKLKAARVLVVGLGGLGSPAAMYLAAAGVGRLGLIDPDTVDITNLQRQIAHGTPDVGRPKARSARDRLEAINPHVTLDLYDTCLDASNARDILAGCDVVVDATDNFAARYLISDACALLGKMMVYGSIYRFEGQVSIFDAQRGPCYRCLFPQPPPDGATHSAASGVFGVLPGVIGAIQATEALKVILGIGEPLVGRLLLYDALAMHFDTVKLQKNPQCPACGASPTLTDLVPCQTEVPSIGVEALKARLDVGEPFTLLDIREPYERRISVIPGTTHHIPMGKLKDHMGEIDWEHDVVIYCRRGSRSAEVVADLQAQGYTRAINLAGGVNAWARQIDPALPVY